MRKQQTDSFSDTYFFKKQNMNLSMKRGIDAPKMS